MKQEFYILGAFEYVADVQILRAKLESEGIPVFLKDEYTLHTDPLLSTAIGGVKVQVYTKDKDRAIAIYNELRSYALDTKGNPVACPNCKAMRSEIYHSGRTLLNRLFPFLESRKYRCLNCGMITKPLQP